MATIRERLRKDGSKVFQVQIRLRGQRPTTMTFKRKTDAQKWIQNTESAIREGRYFKKSESRRHTVGELIDRYIEIELPQKPKMKREYGGQLIWWKDKIGHILLSDLNPPLIVECREALTKVITKRGSYMSNARVNRYLAALSSSMTTAVKEWHWLEESQKVKRLKEPKMRIRYLDEMEREITASSRLKQWRPLSRSCYVIVNWDDEWKFGHWSGGFRYRRRDLTLKKLKWSKKKCPCLWACFKFA